MITEAFLFKALRQMYPANEYALLPQVGDGTGFQTRRHLDAVAMGLWPSRGLHVHGVEIKCSARDWRRELENPEKAEAVAQYCHYFYVCASGPKVCPVEELPENWGLYVWDDKKGLIRTKGAKFREDAVPPTWSFVAAVLRQAATCLGPAAELAKAHEDGFRAGEVEGKKAAVWQTKDFDELKKIVYEFEKASGVSLKHGWRGAARIGEAVKTVLEGSVERYRDNLIATAKNILLEFDKEGTKPR